MTHLKEADFRELELVILATAGRNDDSKWFQMFQKAFAEMGQNTVIMRASGIEGKILGKKPTFAIIDDIHHPVYKRSSKFHITKPYGKKYRRKK